VTFHAEAVVDDAVYEAADDVDVAVVADVADCCHVLQSQTLLRLLIIMEMLMLMTLKLQTLTLLKLLMP
jgi:hypothetical protein